MSIGTKLALLILGLPLIIMLSLSFGLYHFYEVDPELLSALISTVLVGLLVWERLRGSLLKDFKWFHKYVLFKLYNRFGPNMNPYDIQKRTIKRLRADLEEYGRSMGLRLYPGKLPEMIDKFLEFDENFSLKLEKITEWGKKELGKHYDKWTFLYCLELQPQDTSSSSKGEIKEKAQELIRKQHELVNGARDMLQKMRDASEQIHDLLDDFIKDNKLRLEKPREGPPVMT